jgi:hypothetical protein
VATSSVLLGFEVENFRSFRDQHTLQLTRAPRQHDNAFPDADVLPVIAIFGANASGKSNLLHAMGTMSTLIKTSATTEFERLPYSPYVLGNDDSRPTRFELSARIDDVRYDYGFTYDSSAILSEWLYSWPGTRRRVLFERGGSTDTWYFGDSLNGPNQTLSRATRPTALFLSTARLLNHELLGEVQGRLADLIRTVQTGDLATALQSTLRSVARDAERERQINLLMARAEFGVSALAIEEDRLPEEMRDTTRRIFEILMPDATPEELQAQVDESRLLPQLQHNGMSGGVAFPFAFESTGTRNFLALLGPILDRLQSGGVLVVDEIDTSLHPRLVSELVRLFQDPEKNPRQAQLILSTHDVTVIMNTANYNVLAREQVWFVDKERDGASRLYSLLSRSPRKSEVFSRAYLMGLYGAVPDINEHAFWDLWSRSIEQDHEHIR